MHVLFPKKLSFLLVQRISGWLRESDLKPEVTYITVHSFLTSGTKNVTVFLNAIVDLIFAVNSAVPLVTSLYIL